LCALLGAGCWLRVACLSLPGTCYLLMEALDVDQVYTSIGLADVLLLVFIGLGVALMMFYAVLQILVARR